jgi:pimeloyl-ACP methyl ester carboxylesterase
MRPTPHPDLGRRFFIGAAACGAMLAASGVRAQGRSSAKATFVLVHPAWHGAWCWRKVIPFLRASGHEVYTPTLTGLGERSHLARPDIGLDIHVQDVVNVMTYEDLGSAILVGHSSSGVVITGVADRVPERIGHLVYLDAFVPEDGQSMWDVMPAGISRVELEARVQREGQGWLLPSLAPVPWDQFVRKAWHVTDEADVRWMVARLGPTPIKHFKDAVRRTNPAAAKIPRTYIRCPEYPHPVFDRLAETSRKGGVWRYREVAGRHHPAITHPRELANVLLEIAG